MAAENTNSSFIQNVRVDSTYPTSGQVLAYDAVSDSYIPSATPSGVTAPLVFNTYVRKTANYTATTSEYIIYCDATAGSITITLPPVSSSSGVVYIIKKIDSTLNTVVIDANASETIDGGLTATIITPLVSLTVHCDGSTWFII